MVFNLFCAFVFSAVLRIESQMPSKY